MESFNICYFCRYGPPSSGDGKPCVACPADGKEIQRSYNDPCNPVATIVNRAESAEMTIYAIAEARRKKRPSYIVDDILRKFYEAKEE